MKKRFSAIALATFMLAGCAPVTKPGDATQAQNNQPASVVVNDNRVDHTGAGNSGQPEGSGSVLPGQSVGENGGVQAAEAAPVTDAQFEKKGYLYTNILGDTLYFYVVKNNSNTTVEVKGHASAMDAGGAVLGVNDKTIHVLAPGETSLMSFYFDDVSGIDKVECTLSYNTKPYYKAVINGIAMEQTINDRNLTIVATNNGSINAQFVEAYALFFDAEGKVVSYTSGYISDKDFEIKPGATISKQLDAYENFDHVECFLTGRSDGDSTPVVAEVSDSDFAVTEYSYQNIIGDTMWFLAIQNNSEKTVGVSVNMTAYDAAGSVIGAASGSITVLGVGEESIASLYFNNVAGIDHISYTMEYSTDLYYSPVIKDLSVEYTTNEKNAIVTITNNGSEAAEFVEAYALFFDADGKIVQYTSNYFSDEDFELKPGAAITKQMNAYGTFSNVKIYITGRRGDF
ncbi:MAG: hypothetical protein IKS10_10405 [Lachnospiraceae bacterium]|nr:hypothetical protein [Lachnospiraceae bacterium]